MKTKPFNLEEAKAGKKFMNRQDFKNGELLTRIFLAEVSDGRIVYEYTSTMGTVNLAIHKPEDLVMIMEPKIAKGLFVEIKGVAPGARNKSYKYYMWEDCALNREAIKQYPNVYRLVKEFEFEYEEEQ